MPAPSHLIKSLAEVKASFGTKAASTKLAAILELSRLKLSKATEVLSYHESLCYLRAYPDDPQVLDLVEAELEKFLKRVERLARTERRKLDETGIVGTELSHSYGYFMTQWMLRAFPGVANLDWTTYQQGETDPILDLMPVLLSYCENDAVDDPQLPSIDIIEADINGRGVNKLEWLVKLFERLPANTQLKRLLFDKMDLPMTIKVGNQPFARTNVVMPADEIYFQKAPLQKEYPDLRKTTKARSLETRLLSRNEARFVVDTHKMAMIMRHRELWPLTFSNLEEVYATDIGRGMTIYIMGMQPEWRLPVESNYAALLVRNGIPIGYGIGAMAFERIEIAINIFESFRKSEAGFIFGKFAELYYQLFGCNYMMIRKYQVGYNNPEGLDSGAYWFYYKLGFRSIDREVRELANREARRISSPKGYRSSLATLKQLAQSDMCLDLRDPMRYENHDVALGHAALAETRTISKLFDGDRNRAGKEAPGLAKKLLGVRSTKGWNRSEQMWFDRLSVLALALPGITKWSVSDKKKLAQVMRAKGAVSEQPYTQLLRQHRKLAALGSLFRA